MRWMVYICLISLAACGGQNGFEKNVGINGESWSQSDTASIVFDIDDTTRIYDIYINIRNARNYNYMNLWVFLDMKAPDGELWRDTVHLVLADEKGKWRSDDVSETYVMSSFKTYNNYRFPQTGTYKFMFTHGMYDEPLEGISDVGVKLEEVE